MPTDNQMRKAASAQYESEGALEIDDNAPVSRAEGNPDKGAYVQAWVWVDDESAAMKPNYTGRAMRAMLTCNQVMMRYAYTHPRYIAAQHRFNNLVEALNRANARPYFARQA